MGRTDPPAKCLWESRSQPGGLERPRPDPSGAISICREYRTALRGHPRDGRLVTEFRVRESRSERCEEAQNSFDVIRMDMDAIAEVLCHLKTMRVYLRSTDTSAEEMARTMEVEWREETGTLTCTTVAGQVVLPTTLHLERDSTVVVARTDHVEVRIKVLGGEAGAGTPIFKQRDALPCDGAVLAEVKWLQERVGESEQKDAGTSLHCGQCGNVLLDRIKGSRVLPSPYWKEVAELWFCNCGKKADQNFAALEALEESIVLEDDVLMIGETVCVLSTDSLDAERVEMASPNSSHIQREEGETKLWSGIKCKACQSHLGHLGPTDGDASDAGAEKKFSATLFKHKISTSTRKHTCPLFRAHQQQGSLAADLFTTSRARGSYRFLMKPIVGSEADYCLQLVLLNWDLLAWMKGRDRFCRTLKVMYKRVGADQSGTAEQWANDHEAEHIYALEDELEETLLHLKSATARLPPSCQSFSGFQVGFLFANMPSALDHN